MKHEHHDEVLALADAFCRDDLTAEQQARLEELVTGNDELRRVYVRYVHMHVCLRRAFEAGAEPSSGDQRTPVKESVAAQQPAVWSPPPLGGRAKVVGSAPQPLRGSPPSRGREQRLPFARLAASVLILAGIAGLTYWLTRPTTTPAPTEVVATLTNVVGCAWQMPQPPQKGDALAAGKLELSAGIAEVTFAGGTVVLVEAPATLELIDAARGFLHAGRVVVRVPPPATGFVMETARARLVDRGTEFGVGVDRGDTLLQVFDGEVVAHLKEAGAKASATVTGGQSLEIDRAPGIAPRSVASAPDRFVRRLPDPKERGNDWLVPYNDPRYDRIHIVPAPGPVKIDGDLADWDRSGRFFIACQPPYIRDYHVDGAMMFDDKYLYVAATVGDPAPMCSVINPQTDPSLGWKGGAVQVRLNTDRQVAWPVDAESYLVRKPPLRPQDKSNHLVHLTMWYYQPGQQPCLHIAYGMQFRGDVINPAEAKGAFVKHADGRGYTMEYAIPWSLLHCAADPPRGGDELAACWNVHWSGDDGRLWRGYLVDILNPSAKGFTYQRAQTWGRAVYHKAGNLAPGTVVPRY